MGKNNENDLTLFCQSIMWLEQYIEQAHFFSDWEQRKQTDYNSYIKWVNNQTPADEVLKNLGTCLHIGFNYNGKGKDRKSPELREAAKTEFYKWINATKIDNDCSKDLKKVLFAFHEVIGSKEGGYKLRKSIENAKGELEPGSPEYMEQLQTAFSLISKAHASEEAYKTDNIQFNGNAETGKATFATIANSLSVSDKENFHFWPQMTEEERIEEERKNKELNKRIGEDPFLYSKRINAINKITHSLNQEPKLVNNDLGPENQNWEIEIKLAKNIIEIQNIEIRILADIKKKRQTKQSFLQQQEKRKNTKSILIIGATFATFSLIIILVFYYWKKNEKRK